MVASLLQKRILGAIEAFSEKVFVVDNHRRYYYHELREYLNYVCELLVANHYDKVAIVAKQGFFSYCLLVASYLVGATFCVVNVDQPLSMKKYILEQFRPSVVFCSNEDAKQFENTPCLENDLSSHLKHVDTPIRLNFFNNEYIYISFTSGSTGQPKGCKIFAKSVEKITLWAVDYFEIETNEVYGQYAPIHFDMSLVDIFGGITKGVQLIVFSSMADKLRPANLIEKYKIGFLNVTPQFVDILVNSNGLELQKLASLRAIRFGGDKIYTSKAKMLFDLLPNLLVISTYGPTETTFFCCSKKLTKSNYKDNSTEILTIGQAIPNWNILLRDINDKGVGEIVIFGDYIGDGYLNYESNSFRKIEVDGKMQNAYFTGDFATSVNGNFYFVGRKDSQVKINGQRASLSEVDFAMMGIVEQVASFFVDGKICCFYVGDIDSKDITEYLSSKLVSYMIPRRLIKIDCMPYNHNGKIDRQKLIKILEREI